MVRPAHLGTQPAAGCCTIGDDQCSRWMLGRQLIQASNTKVVGRLAGIGPALCVQLRFIRELMTLTWSGKVCARQMSAMTTFIIVIVIVAAVISGIYVLFRR
jgi:hypothetical protein